MPKRVRYPASKFALRRARIGVVQKRTEKGGKRGRNEGGEMKRKEKERELGISMDNRTGLDCTGTKIS